MDFVCINEDHEISKIFEPNDFKMWYKKDDDRISHFADKVFYADGFTPILLSADLNEDNGLTSHWINATVVGEKIYEGKRYIINLVDIRPENPIAQRFYKFLKER